MRASLYALVALVEHAMTDAMVIGLAQIALVKPPFMVKYTIFKTVNNISDHTLCWGSSGVSWGGCRSNSSVSAFIR